MLYSTTVMLPDSFNFYKCHVCIKSHQNCWCVNIERSCMSNCVCIVTVPMIDGSIYVPNTFNQTSFTISTRNF